MSNKVQIDVKGIWETSEALIGLEDKLKRRVLTTAFTKAGRILVKAAKARVPVSSKPHHRYSGGKKIATYYPGNLKKSIGIVRLRSKDVPSILVGPITGRKRKFDGYYRHMVEHGTKHSAARPFMRPAFEATKGEMAEDIKGEIVAALKKLK